MLKMLCISLHLCSTLSGEAIIIDGDTISVERIHVRIQGIDAEELYEKHGKYARDGMNILLRDAKVTCHLNGERSYNRYIGTCYVEGHDVAQDMVTFGYALDCAHYSNGRYRQYEPGNIRLYLSQKPYC